MIPNNESKNGLLRRLSLTIALSLIVFMFQADPLFSQTTGQAISFNGMSDYIILPSDPKLTNFTQITIELWIKPTSFDLGTWNASEGLVAKGEGANAFYIWINRNSDNQNGDARRFSQFKCDFGFGSASASSSWHTPGSWYHIATTYDGKTISVYVNGVSEGTGSVNAPTTVSNTQPIFVNHHTWDNGYSSSQRLGGLIDEFRLWNRSLPPDEIKSTMNTQLSGNEEGLLVYYNFDDLTGNHQVKDSSPNALHGTITGNAHLVSSDAPVQVSPAMIKESTEKMITRLGATIDQLKSQNLNTSVMEKALSESKDAFSKDNYELAQKLIADAQSRAQKTQGGYAFILDAKAKLGLAKEIGCQIAEAENKLKESEDALNKGDYASSERLVAEAITLSLKANCGKTSIKDLQALAAKYDGRTITISGEARNIQPNYGQGYTFSVDDGSALCTVNYEGSMKNIDEGDFVTVEGTFDMNGNSVHASNLERGSWFTFSRITMILVLVIVVAGGIYYRSKLLTAFKKMQQTAKTRAQKALERIPSQTLPHIQVSASSSASNIFTSPAGAAIAAICFFLPWAKFSCGGMHDTASGADLGGILWIVFIAAIASLGAFFYFRSQNQTEKAKPIILWSSLGALAILVIRYIMFMSGEKTEYGTIRPKDIGFSIQFGAIGTLIGFVVALFGTRFLSRTNSLDGSLPAKTEESPVSQPK
jgi:hypothetical protein